VVAGAGELAHAVLLGGHHGAGVAGVGRGVRLGERLLAGVDLAFGADLLQARNAARRR